MHDHDFQLALTQSVLDELLQECVGVGGEDDEVEVRGGIGEEYKDHHAGRVWRFEEHDRNGETGADSFSVKKRFKSLCRRHGGLRRSHRHRRGMQSGARRSYGVES